ncbi:MAG: threonylcarbamoyl-AMP synthase [Lachnospiraceae bacterium]|nr:threonylcarbamoyl-AMP synthase [Lachnospiraceae bacterium]
MKTIIKKIDKENMSAADFAEAADILRNGGLVAFPTETVYGLGGDARNPEASAKIYAAKGRPSDNPLIVHIAEVSELDGVCGWDGSVQPGIRETALTLAQRFWPGPLTMVLPRGSSIPKQTTGGLDTVAVRLPSHPVARMLIKAAGLPVAAPSANLSGRPSTTKAEHVIEDLSGRIDMIIDSGSSQIGLESTIVDLTCSPPLILRPGYISIEQLREVLPDIDYDPAIVHDPDVTGRNARPDAPPKAPGMKYRHYAPKGELTIFEGTHEAVVKAINKELEKYQSKPAVSGKTAALGDVAVSGEFVAPGEEVAPGGVVASRKTAASGEGKTRTDTICKVGVLASSEYASDYNCRNIRILGSRDNEAEIAAHLFDALRSFDADGTQVIFGECFTDGDLGAAIMNRLIKAAGYRVVKV